MIATLLLLMASTTSTSRTLEPPPPDFRVVTDEYDAGQAFDSAMNCLGHEGAAADARHASELEAVALIHTSCAAAMDVLSTALVGVFTRHPDRRPLNLSALQAADSFVAGMLARSDYMIRTRVNPR